ncbi:hypothetical protein [Marinobacter similis]|uniref:hypothetical protein n=1 Tax=Marinobacter similis TaxID=1420916 RepID=UPI000B17CC5D|nr:hypothetical protein [Marinobacter similis]
MASSFPKSFPNLLGALALGVSVSVDAASYGAGIENSQWYLSESVFECAWCMKFQDTARRSSGIGQGSN